MSGHKFGLMAHVPTFGIHHIIGVSNIGSNSEETEAAMTPLGSVDCARKEYKSRPPDQIGQFLVESWQEWEELSE
eukprot:scaffold10154_cov63-Cyclotella_meneghiniana.AAC.20